MIPVWLSLILASAWKGALLVGLAWTAAHLLRARSAALRHLVWTLTVLSLLALPLVMVVGPSWDFQNAVVRSIESVLVNRSVGAGTNISAMVIQAGLPDAGSFSGAAWVVLAWAIGVVCLLLLLAVGTLRLHGQVRRSKPVTSLLWTRMAEEMTRAGGLRPLRLLASPDAIMPMTFGFRHPCILVPAGAEDWTADRVRAVLSHELSHVQRGDWLVQLLAETARAIYWFHPFVWLCCRRLRQESEQACDDAVLRSGMDAHVYATHLLELARTLSSSSRSYTAALAMAHECQLEKRFISMLNPFTRRGSVTRVGFAFAAIASVCILLPVASLQSLAQTPSGRCYGSIYDPSGGLVPNATIVLSNATAMTKDMTTSNAAGVFEFSALQAGDYSMEVLKPGFARYVVSLKLDPYASSRQNATLQIGSINEQVDVVAQGTAGPGAAAPAATATRLRIGGNVQATKLIAKERPVYPSVAKAAGVTGSVMLGAVIGTDGALLSLRVLNSQIDPDLAKSAVEAVSKWRYSPTLLNGVPVEVATNITVNYTLQP